MRKSLKILSILGFAVNSLFGSIVIDSDEGVLVNGISTFTGHVVIQCSDNLSIRCDELEHGKEGFKLTEAHIQNPEFLITSKKAIFDKRLDKGQFSDEVFFQLNDLTIKAAEAECLLDHFKPQQVSLFSQKKDGCTLKSDKIRDLVFQRVNFDIIENQALFFFPRGELIWEDKPIAFSANVMKVEDGRVVLDGKIQIQVGKAVYTGAGPLVIHFDPQEKVLDKCFAEGKSALAWNDYLFDLDGSFQYDSKIHKMFFKTPQTNGLNFKYPLGEVVATFAEITLNTDNLTIEEIHLTKDVFATYGIPTVQFLLADSIRIKPVQRLATLYSRDKDRVLLYDQVNKLEMSSNQVNIEWGEKLGEERIEGIGDVRFSFDQKEKGIIDALFRSH